MRRVFLCFSTIIFFLSFLAPKAFAAETIRDFSVGIQVNQDGTISVEERIGYDFGSLWRHGIFREIPFIKETGGSGDQGNKKYKLDFAILGVEDENGQGYRFEESKKDGKIRLKIGDPDKKITGVHTYIIRYRVSGALTYFADHDELYWNVTGNGWDVPIQHTSAIVHLYVEAPGSRLEAQGLRVECFTGGYGRREQNCIREIDNNGNQGNSGSIVNFETTRGLVAGEGLTIVVGWPKGIVKVLKPETYKPFWETVWGLGILGGLGMLGIFWYIVYPLKIVYKWFKYGRDPGVGAPVRAWFDPPKTKTGRALTPGEVGTLVDETVHLRDIAAILTDLARRGYFRIEERKMEDFYFVERRDWKNTELLDFEKELLEGLFGSKDEVRLKNKRLYSTVIKVKKLLYEKLLEERMFPQNPNAVRMFYTVIGIIAVFTVNIFLAIVAFTFGRRMPRKTKDGAEAARIAASLKNFLASQERQIEFAVEKGQDQVMFEKLLPYAVAFGVEKIWAKRFEGLDMREPEWYRGYERNRFNSAILVNSLARSFSSVASAASPPTSTTSSSGFSSGFSGGFSGGGGGGGGGGSW